MLFLLLLSSHLQAQYVTYERDVKPIMQKHCVSCHAPGEVGPMSLTTYEDVSAYGAMIYYVTSRKLMPPWAADPSYSQFSNERVMSAEEIQTIRDWVDGDMKPGALPYGMAISNAASVTVYPREPDLILSMDTSFDHQGDYTDRYKVFTLQTNLKEDTWIEAIEFVPGNKQFVRYAAISVIPTDTSITSNNSDPLYRNFPVVDVEASFMQPLWYVWSPYQQTIYHTEGRGKFIPKASQLQLYVHYGPTHSSMKDSSFVQLHFASERIKGFVATVPLIHPFNLPVDSIFISANQEKSFQASYTLPHDIELFSITPQANMFCRKWEIFAMIPGQGDIIPLLKINDWNFHWRQSFLLQTPMRLPAGAVIHAIAQYDNTINSPGNYRKTPVDIRLGDMKNSDMFSVYFEYTVAIPDVPYPVLGHIPSVIFKDFIPLYLLPSKEGEYRFEVISMDNHKTFYQQTFTLQVMQQHIELVLPTMPYGNYLLKIWNDDNQIVSSHAFVKMAFR